MNNHDHRNAVPRPVRNATLLLGATLVMALSACRPADTDAPAAATPAPEAAAPVVEPAPAPGDAVAQGATVVQSQWQCGDERVSARFDQVAESVTVVHGAGELVLPQVTAASGARYADNNGNEFWTKGAGGTLTLSGTAARECTQIANSTPSPAG